MESQPQRNHRRRQKGAPNVGVNPLGELWLLFSQNDTAWWDGDLLDVLGEDKKVMNTTLIQPVLPMQLTENVKMILRPTIPINSFDAPGNFNVILDEEEGPIGLEADFDRKTGLGDIVLWSAFATNESARPPNIFGLGGPSCSILRQTTCLGRASGAPDPWLWPSIPARSGSTEPSRSTGGPMPVMTTAMT